MSWWASILIGVLTATFGAVFGFMVAKAAVEWLRVSAFEGAAGYFVVLNASLALVGGLATGIMVSRYLGGDGWYGFARGLGWSMLLVGGGIILAGGLAWLSADREPLAGGQPLDLLVEVSVPEAVQAKVNGRTEMLYITPGIILFGGRSNYRRSELDLAQSRKQDGRWIIGGRVEIHNTSSERVIGVDLRAVQEQYFDLPLAGKPQVTAQWSDWLVTPHLSNRTAPPTADAFALRFRVIHRQTPSNEEP